jgi:hypothetical protein
MASLLQCFTMRLASNPEARERRVSFISEHVVRSFHDAAVDVIKGKTYLTTLSLVGSTVLRSQAGKDLLISHRDEPTNSDDQNLRAILFLLLISAVNGQTSGRNLRGV